MYIKTMSLFLSLIFITNINGYSIAMQNTLRVPVGDVKRINDADNRELIQSKELFRIPNSDTVFYIYLTSNSKEIIETLDTWFDSKKERYFKRPLWETVTKYNGFLIKLVSKEGKILGIAYVHKEKDFWFSYDIKHWRKNNDYIYEVNLLEISSDIRDKNLGQLLVASIAKKF